MSYKFETQVPERTEMLIKLSVLLCNYRQDIEAFLALLYKEIPGEEYSDDDQVHGTTFMYEGREVEIIAWEPVSDLTFEQIKYGISFT